MNIEELVEIHRNSGFIIKKYGDSYFLNKGLLNYSFPQLDDIKVNKRQLNLIRFKYPLSVIKIDSKYKNGYEFILETDNYKVENFNAKARNMIRRSLKDCTFRRPSLADLLINGLEINRQTMLKHGIKDRLLTSKNKWQNFVKAFYENKEIEIFGAYIGDNMVGYIMAYNYNGKYIILNPYFNYKASCSGPMNGLLYTLVNHIIAKNGKVKISYGLESFFPIPTLNKFKYSMLFRRIPITRVSLLNPLLVPFVKLIVWANVSVLRRKTIKNMIIRNIVFVYQGHRLLTKKLLSSSHPELTSVNPCEKAVISISQN
jgi:hypothetical protein